MSISLFFSGEIALPASLQSVKTTVRFNQKENFLFARVEPACDFSRVATALSQHVANVGLGWQLASNGNGFRLKYVSFYNFVF